jgi:hypothetical protein
MVYGATAAALPAMDPAAYVAWLVGRRHDDAWPAVHLGHRTVPVTQRGQGR